MLVRVLYVPVGNASYIRNYISFCGHPKAKFNPLRAGGTLGYP